MMLDNLHCAFQSQPNYSYDYLGLNWRNYSKILFIASSNRVILAAFSIVFCYHVHIHCLHMHCHMDDYMLFVWVVSVDYFHCLFVKTNWYAGGALFYEYSSCWLWSTGFLIDVRFNVVLLAAGILHAFLIS